MLDTGCVKYQKNRRKLSVEEGNKLKLISLRAQMHFTMEVKGVKTEFNTRDNPSKQPTNR